MCVNNIDLDKDYLVSCTYKTGQAVCLGSVELKCQEIFPLGSVIVTEALIKVKNKGFPKTFGVIKIPEYKNNLKVK